MPTWEHNKENFAENTKLCAAILTGPQSTEEGGEVCTLPGGEEVNFYQVIPLYEDELDYKLEHDVDALLDKMAGISFVVNPTRQDAITRGTLLCDKQTLKRCNSASLRLLPHRRSRPLCHTFRAFRHKQDSTLVAEQTAISSIFAFFVSIYSVFVERPG